VKAQKMWVRNSIFMTWVITLVGMTLLGPSPANAYSEQQESNENNPACQDYLSNAGTGPGCSPVRYYMMPQDPSQSGFAALDGNGIVLLGEGQPRLQYGVATLGGYDSAFAGRSNLSAPFVGGQGYLAFVTQHPRWNMVLQNSGGGVSYRTGEGTSQYFDQAAIMSNGNFSAAKSWNFEINNTIANDAIRILGPLNTGITGSVNTPPDDAAAFGIYTGLLLDNQVTAGVQLHTTATRSWIITAQNGYRKFFDDNTNINTARFRVQYQADVSPLTTLGLYEETGYQSGTINCAMQSVGGYLQRKLGYKTFVQVGGGPAFGTKNCIVTTTYTAFGEVASNITRKTTLYATGSRRLNDSPVQDATWENTLQGGLVQRFSVNTYMRIDAGYLRGTRPTNEQQFDGSFVGGDISQQLTGGFSLQLTARHYQWSGISSSITNRNVFFATLWWTRHPEQSSRNTSVAFAQR